MTSAASGSSVFVSGSEGGKITGAVTVNGGEVKGLLSTHILATEQNSASTVRFGEGISGYTLLSGALIPGPYISTEGRKLNLVENNVSGTYVLSRFGKDGITSLYGNNLTLGSDVSVNFYLDIDPIIFGDAYAEIGRTYDYVNGTAIRIPLSELPTKVIDGNTYHVISYGVPAKDIGTVIIARIVKDNEVISTAYEYSAQMYIDDVLERETGGDITHELKALVKALDVYGKNAAAVLAGGEAAEEIGDVDFSEVTLDEATSDRSKVIRLKKLSLELKSNIKIKVYFTYDAVAANDSFEDYQFLVNGEAVEVFESDDEGVYYVEHQVVASKLSDSVKFDILDANDTGMTLSVSALYYAKIMVETADEELSPANYKNLMKAIKLYADAAEAYAAGIAEDSRPAL